MFQTFLVFLIISGGFGFIAFYSLTYRLKFKMGKLRKKHNWKGRQQSDPPPSADEEKTEVVVELKGSRKTSRGENIFDTLHVVHSVTLTLLFV